MARNLKIITAYLLVYVIWSTTFLAVKTAVSSIPLFFFTGVRWFFSGVFLTFIGIALYKRNFFKGITKKQILSSLTSGFFVIILNTLFFTEAMKTLDTYFAAIIGATSPLFMTTFDFFLNGKKFQKSTLFAIFLGIGGIAVLVYKGSMNFSYDPHILIFMLAVLSFTFGSAYSNRLEIPKNPVLNSAIQMYFAGIACFFMFLFQENSLQLEIISFNSWFSLLYLIIFGGIGMFAYLYLIKHEPLSRVSSFTYVNAIGATILGIFIGEKISANFFIAAPMIFIAVMLILRSRVKVENLKQVN